ncbi:MAG: L,D-transpeptidase [Opitutae bacterium]|nr:L,D-transpeptidase [Opitutae bacterium]
MAKQKWEALGRKSPERLIAVSIAQQRLLFYEHDVLRQAYVVSTSRRPPSNVRDSLGTPRGLHEIAEKIGAGQPPGIVFQSRVATGRHYRELSAEENERNLITTRILWLRGLEPGHNAGGDVDTYARYIYIHGTNHEDQLGTPASAGCVQMRNVEIAEFFEQVRTGDPVWIED